MLTHPPVVAAENSTAAVMNKKEREVAILLLGRPSSSAWVCLLVAYIQTIN